MFIYAEPVFTFADPVSGIHVANATSVKLQEWLKERSAYFMNRGTFRGKINEIKPLDMFEVCAHAG